MIRRALLAGLLAMAAALAGSVAPALAQPFLSIESPSSGAVTNNTQPLFSGSATDTEDLVTVKVFKGGSFYESAQTTPGAGGGWSVQLASELEDGNYRVVAEQKETLTGKQSRPNRSVSGFSRSRPR